MKKTGFAIVILLLAVFAYGQMDNIKVKNVVKEFYGLYDAGTLEYPIVGFEKRKEGWYVVSQKIENKLLVPVNKWLFFDNSSKKFLELDLARNNKPDSADIESFLSGYDIYNYDLQAYYGYPVWYKDVISFFKGKQNLSDDELYALGRAYSAYAGSKVSGYSGYTDTTDVWKLAFNINCLSKKQIFEFDSIGKKATACFKKLADRNPAYPTVVGDIRMKYANEIMFLYQVLLAYADSAVSKMRIPENLYSESQLADAKKILTGCPEGAVLFSYGDNDYYPVHFLQKVKKYRTDVMLININLLGIDRYAYRATFSQYKAAPVSITLGPEMYRDNKFDQINIKPADFVFPMASLSQFLADHSNDNTEIPVLNADSIRISSAAKSGQGEIDLSDDSKIININDLKYLLKNEWLLLEILENRAQRKICFPGKLYGNLTVLNEWLEPRGSVWVFKN